MIRPRHLLLFVVLLQYVITSSIAAADDATLRTNGLKLESLTQLHSIIHQSQFSAASISASSSVSQVRDRVIHLQSGRIAVNQLIRDLTDQDQDGEEEAKKIQQQQLHVTIRRLHTMMGAQQQKIEDDNTDNVEGNSSPVSSPSHAPPHHLHPHLMFNSDFFHAPSKSLLSDHKPRIVRYQRTTIGHDGKVMSEKKKKTFAAAPSFHLPSRTTYEAMQSYFNSSGVEVERKLKRLYMKEVDDDSTSKFSSSLHPLDIHPSFHYQWLIHMKSTVTSEMLHRLEALIYPYRIRARNYIPEHTYLVTLPYKYALRLSEDMTSGKASPILFICLYHDTMKLQDGLTEMMERKWRERISDTRIERTNDGRENVTGDILANDSALTHNLHLTLAHPSLHPLSSSTSPQQRTHHNLLTSSFPSHHHRRNTILTSAFVKKQTEYWNVVNNTIFREARERAGEKRKEMRILFQVVDSTQIIVQIPAFVTSSSPFLTHFLTTLSSHPSVQYIESGSSYHILNKHAKYVIQTDVEDDETMDDASGRDDARRVDECKVVRNDEYINGLSDEAGMFSAHDSSSDSESTSSVLTPLPPSTSFPLPFSSLLNLHPSSSSSLLTIGDTGVDYDHCMFYDAENPVVNVNPSEEKGRDGLDWKHRKIAAYFTSPLPTENNYNGESVNASIKYALPGDDAGHGTHTACSLAGSLQKRRSFHTVGANNATDFIYNSLRPYSGVSPSSRLLIFDFQNPRDLTNLYIPDDIYHSYLLKSYKLGSRVSSNSWGDDDGRYNVLARDIDAFLYEHPDYTMIMAAGNLGKRGMHTIASPAVAKNILTVGATMNDLCSWVDQGFAVGIEVVSAPTILNDNSSIIDNHPVTPSSTSFNNQPYFTMPPHTNITSCYASPSHACSPLLNPPTLCQGKIIFVERGGECTFSQKAYTIQQFGGVLMALLYDGDDEEYAIDPDKSWDGGKIEIPIITIQKPLAQKIRSILLINSSPSDLQFNIPSSYVHDHHTTSQLSDFSSKGPTLDERIKPDVLVPGERIESAKGDADLGSGQCEGATNIDQASGRMTLNKSAVLLSLQGTSMSAPLASGSVALLREYFLAGHYISPVTHSSEVLIPSSSLLKAVMVNGAVSISGGTTPVVSKRDSSSNTASTTRVPVLPAPSYHQGFGRFEMTEVLSYRIPKERMRTGRDVRSKFDLFVKDRAYIKSGEVQHYCLRVTSSRIPLKVTLAWLDPPPVLPAAVYAVNNLDLIVIGLNVSDSSDANQLEQHSVHIGNEDLHASSSLSTQMNFDVLNNVERVNISTPSADSIYSIVVRGTHIPISQPSSNTSDTEGLGQMYSLVVNGRFVVPSAEEERNRCTKEVYCARDCSGHGRCMLEKGASSHDTIGTCKCEPRWAGSDCSMQAVEILPPPSSSQSSPRTGILSLTIQPDQWSYISYTILPGDSTLLWTLDRTSSLGDPDFYWITPRSVESNRTESYPTLVKYAYLNNECDMCVHGVTHHTLKMNQTDLYTREDQIERKGGSTVVLGVFGYCCEEATVRVNLTVIRSN